MSMIQDLINNISLAINNEFNPSDRKYHIYTEDSKTEPTKPYFMIMDISPSIKPLLNRNYKHNELIMIQYHPSDNTSRIASLYEACERLYDCLEVVNGTRSTDVDTRIVDGVLSFQTSFKFTAKEIVNEEPIQNVVLSAKAE